MVNILKIGNLVLYFVIAIVEFIGLYFIFQTLDTHCVLGGEYGISVWIFMLFLPAMFVQTTAFFLFGICCKTVGLDPYAIAFNIISGIVALFIGLTLAVAMKEHCGNKDAYKFIVPAVMAIIAGILHLLLAVTAQRFISVSEGSLDSL